MSKDGAIVRPVRGKNSPQLGDYAVMAASESDLHMLCSQMNLQKNRFIKLFMSRLYVDDRQENFTLVGPFIGAPYAAMILETLIVWGARKILFFGWCGAVSPDVKIGDIIIPTGAIIDEGTSRHYGKDNGSLVRPSDYISGSIKEALRENGLSFYEGLIWSTDAVYRETCERVKYYQNKDVLAVDMELSALFTAGSFREVEVGGVLVVSDEISTGKHVAGFSKQCFKKSRGDVCEAISSICLKKTI
ncbi:MAG: nucleoside phosphorylase [Desulfobacteraceae bacterium]|uniref:Uridine phosphorylase n=1 Tax=Candidatus Desulfaltia bathyphila TaxID=2841697 RepID=A0A8J6N711_9BACT|nr:nucleoside phosphorylase [Candidatus Desulfaltia bathyphila]MBL7195594.1 nucleoside phosphorylase [Desulfobacterales bacterium]